MKHSKRNYRLAPAALCTLLLGACAAQPRPSSEPAAPEPTAPPETAEETVTEQPAAGIEVERPAPGPADEAAAAITALADRYYADALSRTPEIAYFSGVELERHDGMHDNSPQASKAAEAAVDEMLAELRRIDPALLVGRPEWITWAYLKQALESSVALRVCHTELWNVNQMDGWHLGYTQIAQLQPVGTPELRRQALTRWSKLPGFIDQEIENLEHGLELGYSAPRAVVWRVMDQIEGLLELDIEKSPFYSPAARDGDEAFSESMLSLVAEEIYPALLRYRDYLSKTYLPKARSELSITANPDGLACYQASLQSYTTLNRSGKDVYELGQKTVAANKQRVIELGKSAYGVDDFAAIIAAAKADPADRFSSAEEVLEFSRDAVARAGKEMPNWVGHMPEKRVIVVPFEKHEEGTGRSAHYRPGGPGRPGEYRIPLFQPEEQSRGSAETTAFHETWPGHHLQVSFAQEIEGLHPITKIVWFSGPGEGWARYAEGLAEEMGLYTTTTGPITRRAWPARGMVVDPGIHLFGWTRQQAIDYMKESGRFPATMGDQMVDRIAILPGQLTAYDSGALEILALRKKAEAVMGSDFDIRAFHDCILENGTIPLAQLREHVEAWLQAYRDGKAAADAENEYAADNTSEGIGAH